MSHILKMQHPHTPDGRYFVVRGQLWRTSNPDLEPGLRERLVVELMAARRDVPRPGMTPPYLLPPLPAWRSPSGR